jgi:hypothetical protein
MSYGINLERKKKKFCQFRKRREDEFLKSSWNAKMKEFHVVSLWERAEAKAER